MRDEQEKTKVKSSTRKPDVWATQIRFRIYRPCHGLVGAFAVQSIPLNASNLLMAQKQDIFENGLRNIFLVALVYAISMNFLSQNRTPYSVSARNTHQNRAGHGSFRCEAQRNHSGVAARLRGSVMRVQISRLAALFMVLLLLPTPDWATCGGGGGGGMGGMRGGGPSAGPGGVSDQQVYQVPWKLIKPDDTPSAGGLVLYWFPSSVEEFQRSWAKSS
jgi:hypothetical protein